MTSPTQIAGTASVAVLEPTAPIALDRPTRQNHLWTRAWLRIRLLTDVLVLYVAAAMALFAVPGAPGTVVDDLMAAVFPLLVIGMMRARRGPDERLKASLLDLFAHMLGAVSLAAMLMISAGAIADDGAPLGLASRLWAYGIAYLGISRTLLVVGRRYALRAEAAGTPTVIVGAGVIGGQLARRLIEEPDYGLRPVAYVDSDPLPASSMDRAGALPVLGGLDDLEETIRLTGARHVIMAFTAEPDHELVSRVRSCEALGVKVSLVPRLYETINERTSLDHVGGLPLLTFNTVDPQGWQFAIKHALDRSVAFVALLLLSPLMLACAAAVRVTSPGPIWFRQRRVGRDGHEFNLLKFRTMQIAAPEADRFVLLDGMAPGGVEGADRRTVVGRVLRDFSIDELPQLINVLRGDMSLVGPRPERPEFVARFTRDVARYEDRHRVRSGITGWAQVHGLRGQTSIADRVEWDNYYIANWSIRLDVKIVLMTVVELLRFRDSWAERRQRKEAAGLRG